MIEQYLPSASSYAGEVDGLILIILVIVGFWFILAEVLLFGLIIRFSAKRNAKAKYIEGEAPKEKRWVSIPHYATLVFDVFIIFAAIRVWHHVKQEMPTPDETVHIEAQQWAWTFTHAGADGKLGTADDIRTIDELHVVIDKTYHFELTSRDVLHSFSVPAFRLKQDAVPGRVIRGWFKPTKLGAYDVQCAEICGIGHGLMPARLVIESPEQHAAWIEQNAPVHAERDQGPARDRALAGATP